MSASVSLMRLAISRASCPVAWLAESGSERTHAEMACSSIYEIALSTDQSGGLCPGPTGAPCPEDRKGYEGPCMSLESPAIVVPPDQNGTTVRRTESYQATAFSPLHP